MQSRNSSPNDLREIAAIILKLLNLFWQGDETAAVREAIAEAWVEDFAEFDPEIVHSAVREWRRTHKWRPSIAELRAICVEAQDTANWKRERALPKPESDAPAWFDAAMQRDWSSPEFDGDRRSPWQRRSDAIAAQQEKRLSSEELQRGGWALSNEWARQQGYADFAAAERAGRLHSEVVTWARLCENTARLQSWPIPPGAKLL